jgi:hypothetical protein
MRSDQRRPIWRRLQGRPNLALPNTLANAAPAPMIASHTYALSSAGIVN